MQLSSPKNLPKLDRPREKLIRVGAPSLTDLELVQVILGSGVKGMHVAQIAAEVIKVINSRGQLDLNANQLMRVKGLSIAKVTAILAAIEFAKRYQATSEFIIDDPEKVIPLVSEYAFARQEHLVCITLDGARRVIARRLITVGTLNNTLIHPREVFADAIVDRAASIILVHNHPSGICEPSEDDIKVTNVIKTAGNILGIELVDHLIITKQNRWCSIYKNFYN